MSHHLEHFDQDAHCVSRSQDDWLHGCVSDGLPGQPTYVLHCRVRRCTPAPHVVEQIVHAVHATHWLHGPSVHWRVSFRSALPVLPHVRHWVPLPHETLHAAHAQQSSVTPASTLVGGGGGGAGNNHKVD